MKEKIATLVAQGVTPSVIASMVGCTPAYVSQLSKDPSFKEMVLRAQAEIIPVQKEDEVLELRYASTEHLLLSKIQTAAQMTDDLKDLSGALRVVSEAQDRKAKRKLPPAAQTQNNLTVVQIGLPAQAIPHLEINTKNEVIAIEDRALAPMASSGVKNLFETMMAKRTAIATEAKEILDAPLRVKTA